ncbi:AraC family transcriptional regulator [Stutzerimonas nosocomialis]|uniref:AraC family transcriptional regulator n=1 Tax=Stutzerimonas nosocomialis TaxID=1056496 RepID=UPI001F4F84C1|nr:AraC family transcriptional regulator [Stutzerimonas nosocomialis]
MAGRAETLERPLARTGERLHKGTISAQLVAEALLDIERRGHDGAALLRAAGIERPSSEGEGRVTAQAYARLWRLSARLLDDEFFAMDSRGLKAGSFAFMARVAQGAASLGEALETMLAFLRLSLDDLAPRLERGNGLAEIVLDHRAGHLPRAFTCFTLWMIIHGLACWLAGRHLPILGIDLEGEAPRRLDDYRVKFTDNLRFGRTESRLLLNADCLGQPVRRSAAELEPFLARAPGNILVRYRDPQGLGARVRQHLRRCDAGNWPDIEALAAQFHVAPSTLQRKLAAEGQSYQRLKDQLRRDLALEHLARGEGNLAQLSQDLGFADASAFHKAFKKWTGSTPGRYRALLGEPEAD